MARAAAITAYGLDAEMLGDVHNEDADANDDETATLDGTGIFSRVRRITSR